MSFSCGFVFWYWPHYANKQGDDGIMFANDDDFGGFSTTELYIKKGTYDNFKSEILEYCDGKNGNISMNMYKDKIVLKGNEFIGTKKVKKIKAKDTPSKAKRHYNIEEDAAFSLSHLHAVILYCDFTGLCTLFGETFRRLHSLESLKSVINRNKKYWWMSKILREVVEIYGDNYYDELEGPFYTGLSFVIVLPEFSIRLYGPTSTTTQIEISMNFSKNSGIIIQFNNKYEGGGQRLRFFDTSSISSFKEEDERLTFGGSFPLQIISVRNTVTTQNFKNFFKPLYWFDAVFSGMRIDGLKKELKDKKLYLDHTHCSKQQPLLKSTLL